MDSALEMLALPPLELLLLELLELLLLELLELLLLELLPPVQACTTRTMPSNTPGKGEDSRCRGRL
jgi:hypothetical protein